jgi:ABC-type Fe3+-hydroxamate transport system substrate-binding protein
MMSINKTRFIHDMISRCGFINVFADNVEAYPEINSKELALSDPEIIFLSSEPFPFNEKHKKSFQEICPDAKIFLVDGEMFSWYGSRLTNIPFYLQKLLQSIS